MTLTEERSNKELQLRMRRVLKDLLQPVKVKDLVITQVDRNTVRGVLMTICPVEKTESGRDFEVGLAENEGGPIKYVIVDGRRLLPSKTKGTNAKTAK